MHRYIHFSGEHSNPELSFHSHLHVSMSKHVYRIYKQQTRLLHCEKKLARLMFDPDIVNTKDDDCENRYRLSQFTTATIPAVLTTTMV